MTDIVQSEHSNARGMEMSIAIALLAALCAVRSLKFTSHSNVPLVLLLISNHFYAIAK